MGSDKLAVENKYMNYGVVLLCIAGRWLFGVFVSYVNQTSLLFYMPVVSVMCCEGLKVSLWGSVQGKK